MTPTIIAKGIDASQSLREYISDTVDSALYWAQDSIHFITVRVTDLNGPQKGGRDKRCQIHLKVPGMPNMIVSEVSSSLSSAIGRAAQRASHVVERALERAKEIQPINVPVLRRVAI